MPTLRRSASCGVLLAAALAGCSALHGGSCADLDGEGRAGHPSEVARWARPSDTGRYTGYAVGGGSACDGDEPGPDDGTWGWDYGGLWLPHRVILGWFHGRREQGGAGAYETDGPHPLEHKKEE